MTHSNSSNTVLHTISSVADSINLRAASRCLFASASLSS